MPPPSSSHTPKIKMGPEPILLSRKEVDGLYETLEAVKTALASLNVDYIVTGGSLLGAIRQHSILFCDDDIDMAILDYDGTVYDKTVVPKLQEVLGKNFVYQIKPWEGGDRIRPKRMNNIFLDLFVLRKYESIDDLVSVIGKKKNGQAQPEMYVQSIIEKMEMSAFAQDEKTPLWPCWQFSTRKAVEMWTKEVYRESELFPIVDNLKMGPITGIKGPQKPVRLLKRAFGMDCFEVYYQSSSHKESKKSNDQHQRMSVKSGDLPPLVSAGGTWEGGQKVKLSDEHYLPMQPITRAARRPTLHCRQRLDLYLKEQIMKEEEVIDINNTIHDDTDTDKQKRPRKTVYMDGVFDLFHIGHLEAIKQCASLGDRVIVGVTGDIDATGYKRAPIVPQSERVAIVEALDLVNYCVCPCPLVVTEEFMRQHSIDLVVHGFANDADAEKQRAFFEIPIKQGKFQRISYYNGLSTTDRIHNIQKLAENQDRSSSSGKPQWFGYTLAAATENSPSIPTDPFPFFLRQIIEPHIEKARIRRREALKVIQQATGTSKYESLMKVFISNLATEGEIISPQSVELRSALLKSVGLAESFDLSSIHHTTGLKDHALYELTKHFSSFQSVYDNFVRSVCAPIVATMYTCDEIYYQAFPCLRIIQPGNFSIGPHADVVYGHHPCSLNFYIPMTKISGTSALFLESRPGSEDWHPIEGDIGLVKYFAGATCLHWTTENKTDYTRVSLDFRLIPGSMFHCLKCEGSHPGGNIDVYRKKEGYYSRCTKNPLDMSWKRDGSLLTPDARVGFPWTVKNWEKFWKKSFARQ